MLHLWVGGCRGGDTSYVTQKEPIELVVTCRSAGFFVGTRRYRLASGPGVVLCKRAAPAPAGPRSRRHSAHRAVGVDLYLGDTVAYDNGWTHRSACAQTVELVHVYRLESGMRSPYKKPRCPLLGQRITAEC
ncbi:hypothetical protein EVAR_102249_1 [Eumeta japonica]|uniref:Uncharacterized protein n=1 Tax=Eumeta variegata TaxID=151549 RepID=A0A4C1WD35_EUMVA|nr:hypothetical protein EVAR_102249_1 [Eumeta japonica]